MKLRVIVCGLSVLVSLVGCGNLNSIHRPLQSGEGALIDIKQRAIIAGKPLGTTGTVAVCSEPSPDAMAAYALEVAAKAEKAPVEFALASQETAAYTGLRTSSIQLLRDQLFNNCLSYLNGAIDKAQFDLMARRYQKQAVAMLAIEQLTGALKANAVLLTTSGTAQTGASASDINKVVIEIEKEIVDLTAKAAAESDAAKKSAIEAQVKLATDRRSTLLKNIGLKTAVTGNTAAVAVGDASHAEAASGVAQIVRDIARDFVGVDDTSQLCLLRLAADEKATTEFGKLCARSFNLTVAAMETEIEVAKSKLASLESSGLSAKEKSKELAKIDLSGVGVKALTATVKDEDSSLSRILRNITENR